MTAKEAYQEYSKLERAADEAYLQFWVQKFASANIAFTKSAGDWLQNAKFNGFELEFYTYPRRFNGARIYVRRDGKWIRTTMVKSESGFAKLMQRLRSGY